MPRTSPPFSEGWMTSDGAEAVVPAGSAGDDFLAALDTEVPGREDGQRKQLHELQFRGDGACRRLAAARVLDAADRLAAFPRMGRPTGDPGLRLLRVDRTGWALRYRIGADRIGIVDVVLGGRA